MRASAWLGYDPVSGVGQYWNVEPGSERTLTQGQSRAHVMAILEDNKRQISADPSGERMLGRKEATIPAGVYNDWLIEWAREGIPLDVAMNPRHPEMQRRLALKLNDPEWRHLRTAEGRF